VSTEMRQKCDRWIRWCKWQKRSGLWEKATPGLL